MACQSSIDYTFKPYYNTTLTYTLCPFEGGKKLLEERKPSKYSTPITDNLGMVSALYLYTNTPPHAYGTQAPKVAETVARSYRFNKKKDRKKINILGRNIERMHWEEIDGPFPFNEIHGNFLPSELRLMVESFLVKYSTTIDNIATSIIEEMMTSNSDILTKGKQTYCPFTEQSVTAPRAYKNFHDFLTANGAPQSMNCLQWIRAIFEVTTKKSIKYTMQEEYEVLTEKYNRETKQRERIKKVRRRLVTKNTVSEEESRNYVLDQITKFASYMKHKERGKLDRRAIASANMGLRMFLHAIEEFHLKLGKELEGSTISIGGEEKKAKITSNFLSISLKTRQASHLSQGTEDATKWNECLAPSAFALMHYYMFHPPTRAKLKLGPVKEFGLLFSKIAVMGNFLMSMKQIQLGPGVMIQDAHYFKRIKWVDEEVKLCTEQTQQWYEEVKPYISKDRKYLFTSPGMLMGMLNAGSTTLGLLAANHRMNPDTMRVITLRSSDDSMTKYMSIGSAENALCVEMNRRNLCLIGINLSPDKTFFFQAGFGEYTSWYMDKSFVAQFGVETASIRPQGKNPPDDFFSISKSTAIGLATLSFNHVGAEARLRIGIDNVRRLWRVKRDDGKREGIKPLVLLLSDGGRSPWNATNCHLQEIPLKETYCTSDQESNYLLKCINPDNPFSEDPDEEMVYSKEHGCLILEEVEVPRTVFHYVKRSNRSVSTASSQNTAAEEKAHSEALKICRQVDPTLYISNPSTNVSINEHLIGILSSTYSSLELTAEEKLEVQSALELLEKGRFEGLEGDEGERVDTELPE
uniref:RNA-directed RNA polymerase catalytic subunit n=1 Tax=Blattella germanica orthomyxovirus 1 TaxID=3133491 RepID=A0AAT9JAH8_9ORTO